MSRARTTGGSPPVWTGDEIAVDSYTVPAGRRYGTDRIWAARSSLPGRPWLRVVRKLDNSGWWVSAYPTLREALEGR